MAVLLCGCESHLSSAYDTLSTTRQYGLSNASDQATAALYASDLCVTDGTDVGTDQVENLYGAGAGVFNVDTKEVLYAQNVFDKIYPASTTKVLTAYVAFKYGNLDDVVTVSALACDQESDSSICQLKPGDRLTLRQLLYGLLIKSGNDAAIAIAEGVSGSVEAFMKLMNEEAARIGATGSSFVTPNGLHDENHYTTIYDMYLIFSAALSYGEFTEMISTTEYNAVYTSSSGETVTKEWENSNRFLNGKFDAPEGFTVIGGKTGTTGAAKYCLVLLSKNPRGENVISLVYHALTPHELYSYSASLLAQFASE